MQLITKTLFAGASLMILSGCYHAQVMVTDAPPSTVVIEDAWADGWVYGLVPPDPVDVTDKCDKGVAKVETRLSFLNQLVGGLTFGIYTPMHIRVTCAQ